MTPFDPDDSGPELYERHKVPNLFGPMAERLLEHVPLRVGRRVLDVACGTGVVARLAAMHVGPAGAVVGVDSHAGMLAVARAQATKSQLAIEYKQADATALPFPDGTFDAVLCQQGLQFFADRPGALREMHRVLVPGGVLALAIFGVPSRYNAALAEGLRKYADEGAAACALTPFALADSEAVGSLVVNVGFSAIELHPIVLMRRVEPSQQWLRQDAAGTPYGRAVVGLAAPACAAMIREIAAKLQGLWGGDSFAVPTDINIICARKS